MNSLPVRARTRPSPVTPLTCEPSADQNGVRIEVEYVGINTLQGANRQTRRRDVALIEKHAACMEAHQVDLPIFADRSGRILFGHDTWAAYRVNERETVPVIYVDAAGA